MPSLNVSVREVSSLHLHKDIYYVYSGFNAKNVRESFVLVVYIYIHIFVYKKVCVYVYVSILDFPKACAAYSTSEKKNIYIGVDADETEPTHRTMRECR